MALAAERSHLILPSGTYFSLDSHELRELAELIAEARALATTGRRHPPQPVPGQPVGGPSAARRGHGPGRPVGGAVRPWRGRRPHRTCPCPRASTPPSGPISMTGFNWLAYLYEHRLGGVLADDMGLGKTLQALALMCHTREHGLSESPYLVVAPTSVVGNWAAECRRFAPGPRRGRRHRDRAAPGRGLETWPRRRSRRHLLRPLPAGVRRVRRGRVGRPLSRRGPVRQEPGLPGLPEGQDAAGPLQGGHDRDAHREQPDGTVVTALHHRARSVPQPDRFTEYYRVPIEREADTDRLAQLRRRSSAHVAAYQGAGGRDLPDKQEQVLELELNPRHRKVYQTYLQRERQNVLGLLGDVAKNRFAIFRTLTLLRQASLDMSLVDPTHAGVPSTKLDALVEMLEDIVGDGHRVLVFSQFTRFLDPGPRPDHRGRHRPLLPRRSDQATDRRSIAEFRAGRRRCSSSA